jgi:hypothetical protein
VWCFAPLYPMLLLSPASKESLQWCDRANGKKASRSGLGRPRKKWMAMAVGSAKVQWTIACRG